MTSSADIYIQATDTDPAVRARRQVETENQRLLAALRSKLALLTDLNLGHDAFDAARAALAEFCASDLRRHLDATDQALYAPAAGAAETRLLVRSLRATVASLGSCVEAFTLVNNHDPKALRREFEASHPGAYTWDYLESGPEQWQVRIGRTADRD